MTKERPEEPYWDGLKAWSHSETGENRLVLASSLFCCLFPDSVYDQENWFEFLSSFSRQNRRVRCLGFLLLSVHVFTTTYMYTALHTFSVRTDFLQNVVSYRRELLLNGILVIWTVLSLLSVRRHLFPVLGFNFLRTFTNPQFCMTSDCYIYNYLMTIWNVVNTMKLPVLWNGFSGAGNVKVSCLSQDSQGGRRGRYRVNECLMDGRFNVNL